MKNPRPLPTGTKLKAVFNSSLQDMHHRITVGKIYTLVLDWPGHPSNGLWIIDDSGREYGFSHLRFELIDYTIGF
jgi:hypothetical protein